MKKTRLQRIVMYPAHFGFFCSQILRYCVAHRTVWPLIVTGLLIVISLFVFATYTATPFLYAVF